jgi:COP9 signalosome complex subunit 7
VPGVAALCSSESDEDKRHHHLLLLFAYETCSTYRANHSLYGELSAAQERKLMQLSIVSLSARHKRVAYEDLKEELQVFEDRELEDLLLDTIYQGLVEGKLDSKNQYVSIDFAIGRDLRQEDLEEVAEVLASWQARATHIVELIDSRVNEARGRLQQDAIDRAQFDERVVRLREDVAKLSLGKKHQKDGGGGGGGGPMMMGGRGGGRKRGPGRGEAGWGDAGEVSE